MTARNKTRRQVLKATAMSALAFPMINLGAYKVFADSETQYSAKAIDLVNDTQVFDMLSIVSPMGQMMSAMMGDNPKQKDAAAISDQHLQTLLGSGIDVFHPAMGLGADDAAPFVARLNALVADHPDHLRRIDAISDLDNLRKGSGSASSSASKILIIFAKWTMWTSSIIWANGSASSRITAAI